MDFAPYQSSPPEHGRVASPDYNAASPRASQDARRPFSPSARSPPPLQHPQPQRGWSGFDGQTSSWAGNNNNSHQSAGGVSGAYPAGGVSEWDTSLGLRLDYEACVAYLVCPPLGAIFLLMAEHNSDYVRFHAWQSALFFTTITIVHLIFSWSTFLSWTLLLCDFAIIGLVTMRAYKDAETLDRYELPVFGRIASRFVDDE